MTHCFKHIASVLVIAVILFGFAACGSSNPCESCQDTPTKGYTNKYSGEKEYYCADCSSECAFCSEKATEHYTSSLGSIVFVCKECYQEILDINS